MSKMKMYEVRRSEGEYFDEVFVNASMTEDEVRKSLIEHDGYPVDIKLVPKGDLLTEL